MVPDKSLSLPQRDDPLLRCFSFLAHLLERDLPVAVLAVGFACDENGVLPDDAYPEMARQHGLAAAWSRMKPSALPGYMMPVALPLKDGRACVLRSISQGNAQVMFPETGNSEVVLALAELDDMAQDKLLLVREIPARSSEQLAPIQGAAFSWFWGTIWRFRRYYADSLLASIVANLLALAGVFFSMNVYDRVVPTQAYASLWTLAIGTTLALVLEFLMRWLKAWMVDIGGKKADLAINATLLREVMAIRLEHRPQSIGTFTSSMRDFEALRDFFSSASLVLLADLPFVLVFIALVALVGGPLAWILVLCIPVILLMGWMGQKPMREATMQNMKESADKHSVLVESLLNLELLKAHNAEAYLQGRWERANLAAADAFKRTRSLTNGLMGFNASLQQLVTVVIVTWGVYLIHAQQLTLGGLIACVILAGRAIAPLGGLMGLAARYQQAAMALQTLDGLVRRPKDREVEKRYVIPDRIRGEIAVTDLEFAYPGEHRLPVIRRLDLEVPGGTRLALLGRVGSGKSTLIRLMAGLYAPLGGSVRVDGLELSQLDPAAVRSRIGYVGQNPQLFMGTLRENLVLADQWIADIRVVEVLKELDLYGLVASHPKGLDMPLTEAGGGLSGGQMQLLALARLMLRDPAIVFMDEPTAQMDQNTEARVIAVLGKWLIGKTLVLATHRPQLLAWVDRIGVLDAGRCVALGPRDEMLERLSRGMELPAGSSQQAQGAQA